MVFKKYSYGSRKADVKKLLRKRLNLKSKFRYHREKADEIEKKKLPELENQIDNLLERIRKKE